ncbi:SH3 domain-containing protein C23A1.17 [Ceratocystis lukuohia]
MAAVPFRVKALFEYTSEHEDDLNFAESQFITVTAEEDDDWYFGEYTDESGMKKEGIFPRNFVEKVEPTAPPRPTRRKKRDSIDPATAVNPHQTLDPAPAEFSEALSAPPGPEVAAAPVGPVSDQTEAESKEEPTPTLVSTASTASTATATTFAPVAAPGASPEPVPAPTSPLTESHVSAPAPPAPQPVKASEPHAPQAIPTLASNPSVAKPPPPAQPKPSGPPPVGGKPTNNAFLQRIAAFNKGGGGPVVPVKPGPSNQYIKKPFVAAPPSRDAYVAPVRNNFPTPKLYRRDEDPEVKEQEAEIKEAAAKAGLLVESGNDADVEDQPKPMSLKERMALLQKQQLEAAQRHADIAAKKEKPKKPTKKRTESFDIMPTAPEAAVGKGESAEPSATGAAVEDESNQSIVSTSPPRHRAVKHVDVSDGNEADMSGAGETTEGPEDTAEQDESIGTGELPARKDTAAVVDEEEVEEEEEDDDIDPEVRRKEELRARMAKLSGGMGMPGMGMAGMFGGPIMGMGGPPAIRKKKPTAPQERRSVDQPRDDEPTSPVAAPAPAPIPIPGIMALPGMTQKAGTEEDAAPQIPGSSPRSSVDVKRPSEVDTAEASESKSYPASQETPRSPPAIPTAPRVPAPESRPAPPLPPNAPSAVATSTAEVLSPSPGSASDDEETDGQSHTTAHQSSPSSPATRSPPPLPPIVASPSSTNAQRIPPIPLMASPVQEAAPPLPQSKRLSRPPPPIPDATPSIPQVQTRAPPPPPPSAAPSLPLAVKSDEEEKEEVTEYDGDYDTDIASSVPHRDALHRDVGHPEGEASTATAPPLPTSAPPPRAVPPRVPSSPATANDGRRSLDFPRTAPPPPPPPSSAPVQQAEPANSGYSYKPQRQSFSYTSRQAIIQPMIEEEEGGFAPGISSVSAPPRAAPAAPVPPSTMANRSAKQSFDGVRVPVRRSIDVGRPSMSMEFGFIAEDIDVAAHTQWFTQDGQVPPIFQNRMDILVESEHETSTNSGAKTITTRHIYVLFQDYSQTILTVKYDPYNASDVEIEQRHEPPPRALRQDQLENSYERYGKAIFQAVTGKKDSIVGDGTPQKLVLDLLRPFNDVLGPIGTRSYGALVYANMANASTQQNDQIRPGDIISFRNARFQGKHGPMHAKYSMDVGKPDHVAVVAEWDGTKKKVRAWEQGRESKKVKMESFKLDDLRSGEVKIWRVMPRTWVGWSDAK